LDDSWSKENEEVGNYIVKLVVGWQCTAVPRRVYQAETP